jgi:2,4-dienoyl-CoA reductase-like NADH-dependent reductase (Old Yellow Enzyme family)
MEFRTTGILFTLGSRAAGGAGLVTVGATAVRPNGRITFGDLGLWNEQQVDAFKPITQFIRKQGAVPGIQLAHAGRKASYVLPWEGNEGLKPENEGLETRERRMDSRSSKPYRIFPRCHPAS